MLEIKLPTFAKSIAVSFGIFQAVISASPKLKSYLTD